MAIVQTKYKGKVDFHECQKVKKNPFDFFKKNINFATFLTFTLSRELGVRIINKEKRSNSPLVEADFG